jgi:hypothetical protein
LNVVVLDEPVGLLVLVGSRIEPLAVRLTLVVDVAAEAVRHLGGGLQLCERHAVAGLAGGIVERRVVAHQVVVADPAAGVQHLLDGGRQRRAVAVIGRQAVVDEPGVQRVVHVEGDAQLVCGLLRVELLSVLGVVDLAQVVVLRHLRQHGLVEDFHLVCVLVHVAGVVVLAETLEVAVEVRVVVHDRRVLVLTQTLVERLLARSL